MRSTRSPGQRDDPVHDEAVPVGPFDLFVLLLTVFTFGGLIARWGIDLAEHVRETFKHLDTFLCVVFLIDFLRCLMRAPNRLKYLATWGWIDLVSSIPGLNALRWARVFRAARIVKHVHAAVVRRTLLQDLKSQLASTVLLSTLSLSLPLAAVASIIIVEVEGDVFRTGEEGLWWSIVTMTTVGYGDFYPRTTIGRILAVVLMTVGVGIFGTFTSYVGAWLTRAKRDDLTAEIRSLKQEIERLRESLPPAETDRPAPPASK